MLKLNTKKIIGIIEYLFIFSLIVECRSIWAYMVGKVNYGRLAVYLVIISCMILLVLVRIIDRKTFKKSFEIASVICVWLLLYWIQDPNKSSGFLILIVAFFFEFMYLRCCDKSSTNCVSSFLEKYDDIMLVIAIVSLFFWFMGSNLGIISPTGMVYSSWANNITYDAVKCYYGIYYETQKAILFNSLFIRNTACFTEAPMASFHFSVAFLTELFLKKEKNIKKLIIFSVAIVTTFSTTGYLLLIFGISLYYFLQKADRKDSSIIKVMIFPLIIAIGSFVANNLVMMKLGTNSGSIRLDDIQAGIKAWSNNIIFGNGYGNSDSYIIYMSSFRSYNKGFSNSILLILAYGGLVLFAPYFIAMTVSIVGCIKRKLWMRLIFIVLFLYIFAITITPFSLLSLAVLTTACGDTYIRCGNYQNRPG